MSTQKPTGPREPGSSQSGETSTVTLLRSIQSGALDAKGIAVSDRRQLVAVLLNDGYSTAEMGQILKVGDRTIERDKRAIREAHAIARDPRLLEQMVGRLVGEAELAVQRIRKTVRDKNTPKALKVDADHRCYLIISDLIDRLQRLGYLPTAAQRVEADLTHHVGDVPDFTAMRVEVRRLRGVFEQTGDGGTRTAEELVQLDQQIVQAELATKVDQIASKIEEGGEHGNTDTVPPEDAG